MKTLVLLVSDQTIPNFLSVKTFADADHYVFVSTEQMENPDKGIKREWIMQAAGIPPEKSTRILVNAEVKEDVMHQLEHGFDWSLCDEIIVNVTGGTKMMSLATYAFFKDKTKWLWYLPIGSHHYHLCDNSSVKQEITWQMSVEEYLDCCGIFKNESRYNEKEPLLKHYSLFDRFLTDTFDHKSVERIRRLFRDNEAPFQRQMKKKGKVDLSAFEDFDFIIAFLEEIDFPLRKPGFLYKDEMDYLTGGWFEEHVMNALKRITGNRDNQFKLGVVLNPTPAQREKVSYFTHNDLDVVFVHNNTLYVVECKTGGMEGGELFNKTVYLASALRKYFLLSVRSVLFTLSAMTQNKKEKAETLGITVVDRGIIAGENALESIAKELKIKM